MKEAINVSDHPEEIKIRPVPVRIARNRLKPVKDILNRLQPIFENYEQEQSKLIGLSKTGTPQEIAQQRYQVDQLENQLQEIRRDLLDLDCVIKDFRTGLVDFVALREGETVWLCYQRGEQELRYYHGWDAGFVGRQEIDFV
jgi:hypothetical protein